MIFSIKRVIFKEIWHKIRQKGPFFAQKSRKNGGKRPKFSLILTKMGKNCLFGAKLGTFWVKSNSRPLFLGETRSFFSQKLSKKWRFSGNQPDSLGKRPFSTEIVIFGKKDMRWSEDFGVFCFSDFSLFFYGPQLGYFWWFL